MSYHLPRPASSGFALSDASRPFAAPFIFVPRPVILRAAFAGKGCTLGGWYNVPVHLRLIDPPDIAAYAPPGGWASKGAPAVPPYEANDNDVWSDSSNTDWGLSATYPGTLNRNLEIDVYPGSSNTGTFYLKLPARYAGDNWQIEVTKKTPGGTLVPNKVPSYSPIFTGWKRVYVERDHMFRRGNLLDPTASGGVFTPDTNTDPDTIYLYRWDQTTPKTDVTKYVQPGDTIVIFDTDSPYPSGAYETATIVSTDFVDAPLNPVNCFPPDCGQLSCQCVSVLAATLDKDLKNSYHASPLDFSSGKSAAVGVIHSSDGAIYDTASNQINGTGSAFYDADTRDIKQPYDDAFTEFIFPRIGMGAVPYLPQAWFSASGSDIAMRLFHQMWFLNKNPMPPPNQEFNAPHDYFHLIGASSSIDAGVWQLGASWKQSDVSYVFLDSIGVMCSFCDATQMRNHVQETTSHELAHQFGVNQCNGAGHDYNNAWCGSTGGTCDNPNLHTEYCIMHEYDPNNSTWMRLDGICKMDCDDLAGQGTACGIPACSNGISVRTDTDPE